METRGIEPLFAHCERAVLPLNDVPVAKRIAYPTRGCKITIGPESGTLGAPPCGRFANLAAALGGVERCVFPDG